MSCFEAVAAAAVPSYSYTEKYISALGVPNGLRARYLMNAAFYQQAALFLGGAVLAVLAIRGRCWVRSSLSLRRSTLSAMS